MESLLVKIFATALALSQVMTTPDAVKTAFDPATDKAAVVQILRDGCTHMRKAFDVENINVDDLVATAMQDPKAVVGEIKAFRGMQFEDLYAAYKQYCGTETARDKPVDLAEVIAYYNKAAGNLPDAAKMKEAKLPGATIVLDAKDANFAELFEPNQRRLSIPLSDIPAHVQQAFISAEDKRFREHHGIDERGVIRAFVDLMSGPGRPQGGSTITQQVAKNILVGDDVTYERKIREILVASRLEANLTKDRILELYLNSIYFGRGSWGIEMAARSYFGKPAKELTLVEGAMLAGITKGPAFYDPDKHAARLKERFAYVLNRMRTDGVLEADALKQALDTTPTVVAYVKPRRDTGFHYMDHLAREARTLPGVGNLNTESYTIHSTINVGLQRAVESALQDGLARYEMSRGRAEFQGPEMNLAESIKRIEKRGGASDKPAWQRALEAANLPLYDVHWTPVIVLEVSTAKKGTPTIQVGLRDGRIMPLSVWNAKAARILAPHDVVYAKVTDARTEGKKQIAARADLRTRPTVQGAAAVIENSTGRVLALAGGFSYPLSQLNRTVQTVRQPGSALKPLVYLAALSSGLQPNTLMRDDPVTFPPIGGPTRYSQPKDYWSPKNYDGGVHGIMTLRRALENSRNLPTARLLDGGIKDTPEDSLDRLCDLAMEAQVYSGCMRYYPFVLGAQPVRLLDLAAFYAAIANEGARPTPHVIESIEQGERTVYRRNGPELTQIKSADHVAFYQLKSMLQGVLARGTAGSIARYASSVGGKTGTSEEENDAWFVGFTNEVTVAVWVGYDNAAARRTLGFGGTGGHIAVPIFAPIIDAVWQLQTPRTALRGPSAEAKKRMAAVSIDYQSGTQSGGQFGNETGVRGGFTEYLRLDRTGRIEDSTQRLVTRDGRYDNNTDYGSMVERDGRFDPGELWARDRFNNDNGARYTWDRDTGVRVDYPPNARPQEQARPPQFYQPQPQYQPQPPRYSEAPRYQEAQPRLYVVPRVPGGDYQRPPARIDQDYFWRRFR